MKCCAFCFNDRGLQLEIIPDYVDTTGTCTFCNSQDVGLLTPGLLGGVFEPLVNVYVPADDGKQLVELLKSDWLLFEEDRLDPAQAHRLLGEILDDGEIIRKRFSPPEVPDSSKLESWGRFRKELMYENRFFPSNKIDEVKLRRLLWYLRLSADELNQFKYWYRARIQKSKDDVYPLTEMGAPPNHLTTQGRANPAGIPYLYLASDPDTAVAEVRPHTGEYASVAQITIKPGLEILDLRNPRLSVSPFLIHLSPFEVDEESEISTLREDISFLVELGKELTRPVLPHAAAIEYLPSQFLCEFIKKCNYHGVIYESSVGDGVNLSLFDPEGVTFIENQSHQVTKVSVEIS